MKNKLNKETTMENKPKIARDIFRNYRKNKLIIENSEILERNVNKRITKNEIDKCKNYIIFIDKILDDLEKGDSWILKEIFINKKDKEDLNYSESTYYWKIRKATRNFMEYWEW